jgi:hypothetical protein
VPKFVKNDFGAQRGKMRRPAKSRIPNIPDQSAGIRHTDCRFFMRLMELWSFACT